MSADERARQMVAADAAATDASLAGDARRILDQVRRIVDEDRVADVPDQAVQDLLLAAVRLFSAKRDLGSTLEAFPADAVTATDVAVTAVAMTKVVNLELFELALWAGWSSI
ncbi:MAG TPA: hypothetical protein VGQ31_12780 [Candidatus Limnocylindrales bacterium]|jgi:hypothetical protein|nr:hypothetical protein [Candidatus Limnocylindrales bacterium]